MNIVILGAGALGSILAGHLARTGHNVSLAARGARAKHLAEHGLTVTGLSDFTVKLRIVERPEELTACDAFVMSAKTYDTRPALAGLRNLKPEMAISVQNGVLKNEDLAEAFGPEHTLGCVANFSGEVNADGTVSFTRNAGLLIGELPSGLSERVGTLADALEGSGVHALPTENIQDLEWSKYVSWLGMTAVAVLSRLYTHRVAQDPDLAALLVTMVREVTQLATVRGIRMIDLESTLVPHTLASLGFDEAVAVVQKAGAELEASGTSTHRVSALQDLLRGRRLEIDETFGYALEQGRKHGIPMPALEACYRLLSGINRNLGS